MPRKALTRTENTAIRECLEHFDEHLLLFKGFAQSIVEAFLNDETLKKQIHFIKYRTKSTERLRIKLERKALAQARGIKPQITRENLFEQINDLAGVRVLHLHTDQLKEINDAICRIAREQKLIVREGPIANCWDREYEALFKEFGIASESRDSMYTSVHYVFQMNRRTRVTAEVQVRTMMEEVWGEVSHRVAYEEEDADDLVIRQLKVLARLTSGSTRLVDSIFEAFKNR